MENTDDHYKMMMFMASENKKIYPSNAIKKYKQTEAEKVYS